MAGVEHVLIVEDDPSLRLLCLLNLELDGFRVSQAGTLEEARAALEPGDVDAVLLDLHVGAQSGFDLLGEIKARPDRPAVVLVTGETRLTEAQRDAADGVISKPFDVSMLAETIRAALR
jgi:DNA-binding response OmpR family regulator